MPPSSDTAEVRTLLRANVEALAAELLPDGRRNGNYWIARNPSRNDTSAGSFWVWIAGERAGGYCDAASGDKGDVFGLIQLVHNCDFKAALAWSRGWLGLSGAAAPARRTVARPVEDLAEDARAAEAERARHLDAVARQFKQAKANKWDGSPADAYLRGRGIDLRRLGKRPGVLGWLPAYEDKQGRQQFPRLIAGFQRPGETRMVALHKTYLAFDGSGKAPVTPCRKIWPSYQGAVIRVWRGGSAMREDEAAECGLRETLVLTEGVEDALSVAIAAPHYRVWAVGSLGNLAHVALPECADSVVVCADNDWGKAQARRALDTGLAKIMAQGRAVSVARSHIGKDVNDALREGLR